MAPSLLFGFLFAGILSLIISPETIRNQLGKKSFSSIFKSALLGVPLPLCSCGVLPVATSFRKNGASRGALASFLISTPQTGVDSILVTYWMLGLVYALCRPIFAFAAGLFGGAVVEFFGKGDEAQQHEEKDTTPHEQEKNHEKNGGKECCEHDSPPEKTKSDTGKKNIVFRVLHYSFIVLMNDIALHLLAGTIIAALITVAMPQDWIKDFVGKGILSFFIMLIFGLPLYVCATASVPIAAALIAKGLSPGAAFVFLMTGPVTNIASFATVLKILGKRSAILYILSIITGAFVCGALMNMLYEGTDITPLTTIGGSVKSIGWWKNISGIILSILILNSIFPFRKFLKKAPIPEENPETPELTVIYVDGLDCGHCVETVENALTENFPIEDISTELGTGKITVKFADGKIPDMTAVKKVIDATGFAVRNIS